MDATELMTTEFVPLEADATIESAWQSLLDTGCSHAIVMDGTRCVGVLHERIVAFEWSNGGVETRRRLSTALVDVAPSTVLPDTDVQDVAMLMASEGVGAVAVVDEAGAPVGVVRAADVVAAVARLGLASV